MDFQIHFFRDLISDGMKSGPGPVFGGLVGYTKAFFENSRSFFGEPQILKIPKWFLLISLEKICWDQKFRRLKKSSLFF